MCGVFINRKNTGDISPRKAHNEPGRLSESVNRSQKCTGTYNEHIAQAAPGVTQNAHEQITGRRNPAELQAATVTHGSQKYPPYCPKLEQLPC